MAHIDNLEMKRLGGMQLSYRESKNPQEQELFRFVNKEHMTLLRLPSAHSVDELSETVAKHQRTMQQYTRKARQYRSKGNTLEEEQCQAFLNLERLSFTSAIALLQIRGSHDALTTLNNRAAFDQLLRDLVLNCLHDKRGQAFVLICVDMAFFKAGINDFLSYRSGDEVLKIIAQSFRHNRPNEDDELIGLSPLEASRTGGDEFAILLSFKGVQRCTQNEALTRILQRLSDTTNAKIEEYINSRLIEMGKTRQELEAYMHKQFPEATDLTPRIRLAGTLVTPAKIGYRYAVSNYRVLKADSLDANCRHCAYISETSDSQQALEILKLTEELLDCVKHNERSGR